MYYPKENAYINESNKVLFDLNEYDIYSINNDILESINKLYKCKNKMKNITNENDREVHEVFFRRNAKREAPKYNITTFQITCKQYI